MGCVPLRRDTARVMSEENAEVVRRLWDAADRRDTEEVLSLYDPDVELDVTGFPLVATEQTTYRGHAGLRRLFAEWREVWQQADSELMDVIDAGDRIVTVYSYRGRGRLSGLPVEELLATVWTLRDRKVVRVQWFIGREEALQAAGLSK